MEKLTHPPYHSAAYAERVEAGIRDKQNRSRLTLHQWEAEPDIAPHDILKFLKRAHATLAHTVINDPHIELLSVSLLPHTREPSIFRPYDVTTSNFPTPGYVFDMDETRPHPALALGGAPHDLFTAIDYSDKHIDAENMQWFLPYYNRFQDEQERREAVAKNPALSAELLDAIGAKPFGRHQMLDDDAPNELYIAATSNHIAAISIPICDDGKQVNAPSPYRFDQLPPHERQAVRELTGALMGLDHLNAGIDVPVMFYHVNAPHQSQFTFFAQGHDMLKEKALAAITTLQNSEFKEKVFLSSIFGKALNVLAKKYVAVDLLKDIPSQLATQSDPENSVIAAKPLGKIIQNEGIILNG